jgi:hypothetical protein
MPCRQCRPRAGDHCQIAEPKPGSSGRTPCNLRVSRALRQPRLPLDARRAAPLPARAPAAAVRRRRCATSERLLWRSKGRRSRAFSGRRRRVTPKRRGEPLLIAASFSGVGDRNCLLIGAQFILDIAVLKSHARGAEPVLAATPLARSRPRKPNTGRSSRCQRHTRD